MKLTIRQVDNSQIEIDVSCEQSRQGLEQERSDAHHPANEYFYLKFIGERTENDHLCSKIKDMEGRLKALNDACYTAIDKLEYCLSAGKLDPVIERKIQQVFETLCEACQGEAGEYDE